MPDPLAVRCRACLAAPGEPCIGTTSNLPRERVHRLRPLAGTPHLVRCAACEGSGWQPTGRATVVAVAITCPVCGSAPHSPCTEGGAERQHVHVVRDRAAKAGLVPCGACDAVGWLPEPPEPEGSAPLRLPVRLGPSSLGTIIDSTGAFIARAAGRELGKAMVVALNAAPSDLVPAPAERQAVRPEDVPPELIRIATEGLMGLEVRRVIANVWPEIERRVREQVAAEILALWPPDDPEDYEIVHAVTDYLRGVCHVCSEPLSAEPCSARHRRLAGGDAR